MKLIKNIILVISIIAFLFQIYFDISSGVSLSILGRVFIVLIQVFGFLFVYWYYRDKVNLEKRKIYFKRLVYLLFVVYLLNLGYLLFLDGEMGRDFHFSLSENIKSINLIPFHTIQLYINSYYGNYLPISIICINLIGNIIAFMPLAIFLPLLFKSQRKWYIYFITVSFIILGVELLQVYTASGSGDIDDYILNMAGSMFMYVIAYFIRKVKGL